MQIIGHRGSAGTAPENTLAAFTDALLAKVDAVEFDVQQCATGELVVIHDLRVDRTTNGHGRVDQLSLTALKSLDAGQGETIPLLHEVLDHLNNKVSVNIELKATHTARQTAELIDRYVDEGKYNYNSFLISSFNHQELLRFREYNTQCRVAVLIAHMPIDHALSFPELDPWSINVDLDNTTPEFVQAAHHLGYRFLTYTVNHHDDFEELRQMGVDGIFTDYPALFSQANLNK